MSMQALLERARRQDREALNELFHRVRPILRALFRRSVRHSDDASDLANEVLVRAYQGFGQFRGQAFGQFMAWVRVIAARVLASRPAATALSLEAEPPDTRIPPPGTRLMDEEELAMVSAALERLGEHGRLVLEGRLFEGLSCTEVARRMGRTPEWVRQTCHRAVLELRALLRREP